MPGPSFAVATLGCKVNQYDSGVIASAMERAGFTRVPFNGPADIYIINTCAVTGTAAQKSRQLARRARRRSGDALVVMAGCYPQAEAGAAEKVVGVDVLVGTGAMADLPGLVAEALEGRAPGGAFLDGRLPFVPGGAGEQARGRALVKIQDGCQHFCSYCLVPYARGRYRSRDPREARDEVASLVGRGHREIVLTGVHLGAYGRDRDGVDLTSLLESLDGVPGLERVRLSSLEPMDVTPRLLEAMAGLRWMCHHLHLPLQSGSDSVLERMNRPYTVAEFNRIADAARDMMPDLGLTTDVMVGFPGESGEEFGQSLGNVRAIGFSRLHVFPYSRRPGTPAATMPDQVRADVRKRRVEEMLELGRELAADFHRRQVGKAVEVLLEAPAEGMHSGYTRSYVPALVHGAGLAPGDLVVAVVEQGTVDGIVAGST